jgi:hypothetical protein
MFKKYNEFLLESILLTSSKLYKIIDDISMDNGDPIAIEFVNIINSDIKTKYNILDTTDDNSKLSFIPDNQANTKIESGIDPSTLFNKNNNTTTIGRVVKSILRDNGKEFTDVQVAKFVDRFKAAFTGESGTDIRIVKGEDIRYWYLVDNYCSETRGCKGSLGKSCMSYEVCQEFLDIYVENPNQVSMVILVNPDGKLRARALLWKTNLGLYLDRIYYTDQSEQDILLNHMGSEISLSYSNDDYNDSKIEVILSSQRDYEHYPYMDSLMYYYVPRGTLYMTDRKVKDRSSFYLLQDTEGWLEVLDMIWCEFEGDNFHEDETVFSTYEDYYLLKQYSVFSKYVDSYLRKEFAVFSEYLNDYLPVNDATQVCIEVDKDGNCTKSDYYLKKSTDIVPIQYTIDNKWLSVKYYLKSMVEETEDGKYKIKL